MGTGYKRLSEDRCCICNGDLSEGYAVLFTDETGVEARINEKCHSALSILAKCEDDRRVNQALNYLKAHQASAHPAARKRVQKYIRRGEEFLGLSGDSADNRRAPAGQTARGGSTSRSEGGSTTRGGARGEDSSAARGGARGGGDSNARSRGGGAPGGVKGFYQNDAPLFRIGGFSVGLRKLVTGLLALGIVITLICVIFGGSAPSDEPKQPSSQIVNAEGGVNFIGLTANAPATNADAPAIESSPIQPSPAEDFLHKVRLDGGSCEIIKYNGDAAEISIPAFVGGYPVVAIGESAFANSDLTRVVIPEGVVSIEKAAFAECADLISVTLPNGLTSIGESAFGGCVGLTSVDIPGSVTQIGISAFSGCAGLTRVVIPQGVTGISDGAFAHCDNLTQIVIPESVVSIGDSAFLSCRSLTSIDIPANVTTIGYGAFSSCEQLTRVLLPDSVTTIGVGAFHGNTSLTSVNIPYGVSVVGGNTFDGCRNLTSIVIPDSVTIIENRAFKDCASLLSVDIPDGVTNIGDYAFYGCSGLRRVDFPNGLKEIGEHAFEECGGLTVAVLPDGLTQIKTRAFYECSGLTNIYIPASVTHIGISSNAYSYVFSDYPYLTIHGDAGSEAEKYADMFDIEFTTLPIPTLQ